MNAQQQVLNALQAALAAGGTVAGARVYLDRADPLTSNLLPAILIEETGGESAEAIFMNGDQSRTSEITVNCVLAATTTAPADCRAFGLAVEKIIVANATLIGLCRGGIVIAHSRTDINGEGDRLLATRQQSWRFTYFVSRLNPDTINP